MADPGTIAALASELAWPVVAVCALVILRSPLSSALMRVTNFRMEAGKIKLETVLLAQLPPKTVKRVMRNKREYLAPQTREVTILLAIVRGSTGKAETADLIGFVRAYQTTLANIVLQGGGTIDSIAAERMTAFWGAPIPSTSHADDACAAATKL